MFYIMLYMSTIINKAVDKKRNQINAHLRERTFSKQRRSTLKAEIFAGRNFSESPKSRNIADLNFANFTLSRKFTEKTFAIL